MPGGRGSKGNQLPTRAISMWKEDIWEENMKLMGGTKTGKGAEKAFSDGRSSKHRAANIEQQRSTVECISFTFTMDE